MSGDLKTVTYNSRYFTVNRIALLAILTSFVTVGRLAFAFPFLPNIQPMTAMLLIITLSIGVIDGLVVSLLSLLLTNIFLGTGPWMLMQIISFTLLILLTAVLKLLYMHGSVLNRSLFAAWAGLTGLIYGFAISLMT